MQTLIGTTCVRSLATAKDLAVKKEAYNDGRVITHWPAMKVKLFPKEGQQLV